MCRLPVGAGRGCVAGPPVGVTRNAPITQDAERVSVGLLPMLCTRLQSSTGSALGPCLESDCPVPC